MRTFVMDKKKQEEYHFVKEKIKKMPADKKSMGARIGWAVLLAAIFGVVAALVFSVVHPIFDKCFSSQNEQVSLSEEENLSAEPEPEPEQVYITETQHMELRDYQVLQNKLYAVGKEANKSVVSVTGIKNMQDWFESDYEAKGWGSGIIIADTSQSFLIVTEKKLIADANEIQVTFYDDATASAQLLAYDGDTGIAVLNVDKGQLSEDTKARAAAADLGNSSMVTQGAMVIAIGSPLGDAFSILTGNVTATGHEVTAADGNYRVISTDISATEDGSGALINLDGKVVGLIMQSYSKQGHQNTVTALGITEIRDMVEKLSNGSTPAYLGLEISTVTKSISEEYNLPEGVYIKNVRLDSPAMEAGIQTGDVIVKIGGTDIQTGEQYETYIGNAKKGQIARITVKRMGADGIYQEVVCEATLGVLN